MSKNNDSHPENEPKKDGTFCRICGTKLCVKGVCTIYCPNHDCGVPGRGTKALSEVEVARLKAGLSVFEGHTVSEVERLQLEVGKLKQHLNDAVEMLAEARALIPDFGGRKRMDIWRRLFPEFIKRIGYESKVNSDNSVTRLSDKEKTNEQ